MGKPLLANDFPKPILKATEIVSVMLSPNAYSLILLYQIFDTIIIIIIVGNLQTVSAKVDVNINNVEPEKIDEISKGAAEALNNVISGAKEGDADIAEGAKSGISYIEKGDVLLKNIHVQHFVSLQHSVNKNLVQKSF